jgi:SAM-dependent methyltransferase
MPSPTSPRHLIFEPVELPLSGLQSDDSALYQLFLNSGRNDLHKWHHYFDIYERHLRRFRDRPMVFLEIGLGGGGSLRMWREYFGPQATIVGVDIRPECQRFEAERTHVRIGDQGDALFLLELAREFGPFDAIVEDGGHHTRQQIESFAWLYGEMTPRGVYLCEDTHTNYWAPFIDRNDGLTFLEFAKSLTDRLNEGHLDQRSLERFHTPPGRRAGRLAVSKFAATTYSVTFYDSIVAFERRPRAEPLCERR